MPEANHSPIKRHCMVVHAYYSLLEVRVQKETKALVDRTPNILSSPTPRPSTVLKRCLAYGLE